jgi:hypothetical protein
MHRGSARADGDSGAVHSTYEPRQALQHKCLNWYLCTLPGLHTGVRQLVIRGKVRFVHRAANP